MVVVPAHSDRRKSWAKQNPPEPGCPPPPQCRGWSWRLIPSGVCCENVRAGEIWLFQMSEPCHAMPRCARGALQVGWGALPAHRAGPLPPGPGSEQRSPHLPENTKLKTSAESKQHRDTHLVSVDLSFHPAVGADWQVVSEVVLAAVRGFHPSTEEQDRLRTGIRPGQDPLLVHTAQHLNTKTNPTWTQPFSLVIHQNDSSLLELTVYQIIIIIRTVELKNTAFNPREHELFFTPSCWNLT